MASSWCPSNKRRNGTRVDAFSNLIEFIRGIEQLETQKRHILAHLVLDINRKGNPRIYVAWREEGLNEDSKQSSRLLHQGNFETPLLGMMANRLKHELCSG